MVKVTMGCKGYCSSKIIFSMVDLLLSSVQGSRDQTCGIKGLECLAMKMSNLSTNLYRFLTNLWGECVMRSLP